MSSLSRCKSYRTLAPFMYDILTFGFYFLMQFHAKFQDISWCPNGARSEKTMLHRVMDTNNKIRKKPVFTGFLRTIYAALCGNIRGFSRFTPLEIELTVKRHVGSNPTFSAIKAPKRKCFGAYFYLFSLLLLSVLLSGVGFCGCRALWQVSRSAFLFQPYTYILCCYCLKVG